MRPGRPGGVARQPPQDVQLAVGMALGSIIPDVIAQINPISKEAESMALDGTGSAQSFAGPAMMCANHNDVDRTTRYASRARVRS